MEIPASVPEISEHNPRGTIQKINIMTYGFSKYSESSVPLLLLDIPVHQPVASIGWIGGSVVVIPMILSFPVDSRGPFLPILENQNPI